MISIYISVEAGKKGKMHRLGAVWQPIFLCFSLLHFLILAVWLENEKLILSKYVLIFVIWRADVKNRVEGAF